MLRYLKITLGAEYNNLNIWYFISFICGIIFHFSLDFGLSFTTIFIISCVCLILTFNRNSNIFLQFIYLMIIAFIFGVFISKYRVINLHGETLYKPIITKISGKIESIKPTIIGAQIVLNELKIQKIDRNLQKIKISIPKKYIQEIRINDRITLLAKLYKPQNSILPGGYDFGFYAYLSDIGAGGYAMSPPQITERTETNFDSFIYKIRIHIYNNLIEKLGKDKGNFAAAILLGETKGLNYNGLKKLDKKIVSVSS